MDSPGHFPSLRRRAIGPPHETMGSVNEKINTPRKETPRTIVPKGSVTSVAALMSPGFTIGQPLPVGYGIYNVPIAYRSTYYDTPSAWYRYNNGYIYQVDPSTMLVTSRYDQIPMAPM